MGFPQVRSVGVGDGTNITEAGAVFAADAAAFSQEPEVESEGLLLACWRILARRRRLVFIGLLSALIAAGVITWRQTPVYRATLKLQIDVDQPDTTSVSLQESPGQTYLPTEEYLKTHCEALASRTLATRVIRTLKLEDDPRIPGMGQPARAGKPLQWAWSPLRALFSTIIPQQPAPAAGEKEPKLSPRAGAFASCVTAVPVRGSRIVAVSFDAPDAVLAAEALNTLASEYIEMDFEAKYYAAITATGFLARQLIDLQAEVEKAEAELATFEQAQGMYAAGEQATPTPQRPYDPNAAPAHRDTAPPNWDAGQHSNLQRRVETSRHIYEGMLQRMKEANMSAGSKSGNILVLDPADVPRTPHLPDITANMIMALAAGLLLGIALAFLAEYLGSHRNRYLKTPEDVRQAVCLPFLGLIPTEQMQPSRPDRRRLPLLAKASRSGPAGNGFHDSAGARSSRGGKGSGIVRADRITAAVELVTHFDAKSQLSEAYRDLRASILLSASADRSPKSLLFTSSLKGEGKTATCVNLAITMAQANEKVLLVDCDLGNPNVHRIFGLTSANGVSTFLSGTSTNSLPLIQFSPEYRLFVFPAGRIPPNPAELIGSMRMKKCLAALAQHFDHILIDGPPLLSSVDARILASFVDGVVLVIKGKTTKKAVGRSRRLLRDAHARILGTMLNNVDPRVSGLNDSSKHHWTAAGDAAKSSDTAGRPCIVH